MNTLELISKVTDSKCLEFLELYPRCKRMISTTANAMGVSRQTIHNWLSKDGDFLDAFDSLKKELDREVLEMHLNNIREIAFDPETPPQTRMLGSFFEVKALDSRYKDKVQDINVSGDIIVQSSIPRPVIDVTPEPKQLT